MKHVVRLMAVCGLLIAFAFGAAAEPVSFTDALGQSFTLEPPQRVVTLMGSFAHIWLLAGGEESLVGTSEDTTDTRDLGIPEHVVSVGTYQNPNMEAIISLDPDLVLLSSDTVRTSNHVALKDSLAAAQIPAAYFKVTHFEDYLAMLKICSLLTGDEAAYAQNGETVALEVERAIAEGQRSDAPSTRSDRGEAMPQRKCGAGWSERAADDHLLRRCSPAGRGHDDRQDARAAGLQEYPE